MNTFVATLQTIAKNMANETNTEEDYRSRFENKLRVCYIPANETITSSVSTIPWQTLDMTNRTDLLVKIGLGGSRDPENPEDTECPAGVLLVIKAQSQMTERLEISELEAWKNHDRKNCGNIHKLVTEACIVNFVNGNRDNMEIKTYDFEDNSGKWTSWL